MSPATRAGSSLGATLVTGGQGFVGSWLVERLLEGGLRVVVPRRDVPALSRFRIEGLESRCDMVDADVTSLDALVRILNEYSVETVFHLAAQTIVATAQRSPLATFEANVRGTYTLLEACRTVGVVGDPVRRIVVASSDKAYGDHGGEPYTEDLALQPSFPYETSKACADLIARSYAHSHGLPVAVVRLANVYGGGDTNFSRLVPETARALVEGRAPVLRSDGSPVRDYVYVADAVEAYLAVAGSLSEPEMHGRAWNVGPGAPTSALEIVTRMIEISGLAVEAEIRGAGPPAGEIDRQQIDASAAREELGWSPRWALPDGLEETLAWYRNELPGHASASAHSDW